MTQSFKAAKHFLELYRDEAAAREVTKDAVYEWWGQTKDQYPRAVYEDVEHSIFATIEYNAANPNR